ncbi:uncharacterized protein LOC135709648 [Ochlerotatus camptorhynchus]|uniref:uncharacterized protein LOC135709648 n=1 Tax=Ochlerotatus camptorhynchus TaxID=644619 RepID=UPI0031DB5DDD
MSDQDIKVQTFNELRLAEDQLDKIPLKKVSRISLNSLRRQECDIEVYEFVFGKVVQCFDPDEFEAEVSVALLPEVLKHLDKIVIELKDNALSCFLLDNLKSFLSFANILLNFAEYVFQVSETYQLYRTTTIFLEFLIRSYEIVRRSRAKVNSEADDHDVVQQIFVICQKIQLIMIHLLTPSDKASHYFQHVEVEEQFTCLKDVIISFCKIGSLTIGIDNIRCTEAWKAVGKLCSLHEAQIKANETAWIHSLIFETNNEIEAAFKSLLENKEFSKNDMVKLKLINLILRVLIKFLHLIKVDEYGEYQGILRTTVVIEDAIVSRNIGKEFTEAIRQHLVVGYMTVIGLTFKTTSFVKALTSINYQSTEEITAFYNIIILIISKLVSESRDTRVLNLYTTNCNLLLTCVEYLSKSHGVFNRHKHLYRQLLVHLSAFVILRSKNSSKKSRKMLEEMLVKMILNDSYWVGMMGLDIWSVYLRYHPVELLWQYFQFWKVVNDRFSAFVSQPKVAFVRRLIHNMYTFMPKSMQQEVMMKYSVVDPGNHKLWVAIGLKTPGKYITETIKQSLLRNLKENCSNLLKSMIAENLYATLHMLHLLCSYDDKNMLQKAECDIIPFWKSLKHDKKWSSKYNTVIYTILNLTVQLAKHGSSSNALQRAILENITEEVSFQSATSKQKLLELVKLVPQSSEKVLKILAKDKNMLIRVSTLYTIATMPPSKVREIVCNDVILSALQRIRKDVSASSHDTRQQIQYGIQTALEHRCSENDEAVQITQHISDRIDELFPDADEDFDIPENILNSETSPAAKRLKLDVYEILPNVDSPEGSLNRRTPDETIAELSRQVKILQKMHEQNPLSMVQLAEIRRLHVALSGFGE